MPNSTWVQRIGIPLASACPLYLKKTTLHLFFLCPNATFVWVWFCKQGAISPSGIMIHLLRKARNNLLHKNSHVSLASICNFFAEEASSSLARISKPFRTACLESFISALNKRDSGRSWGFSPMLFGFSVSFPVLVSFSFFLSLC